MIYREKSRKSAVVLFNHEINLSEKEIINILSISKIDAPKFFVLPRKHQESNLKERFIDLGFDFVFIDDHWMNGIDNYNELMTTTYIYKLFFEKGFQYMLLVQPDVRICNPTLLEEIEDLFEQKNLDYMGAPFLFYPNNQYGLNDNWRYKRVLHTFTKFLIHQFSKYDMTKAISFYLLDNFRLVGNGGLSFRRLDKFIDVFNFEPSIANFLENSTKWSKFKWFKEDFYITLIFGHEKKKIKLAKAGKAIKYFWAFGTPQTLFNLNKGEHPFGIHQFIDLYIKEY